MEHFFDGCHIYIYIYMVRIVYTCDLCVHNLPSNTDTKHVHGGFQAAPLG